MKESFSLLRQKEMHFGGSVRIYENVEADDYPAHWNNSFEVIMPVDNSYTVLVGDVRYDLMPEEILIIPPGTVHEIFAPEYGRRYFFMIDQSQVYAVEGLAAVQHCFYPCVHLRMDENSELMTELRGCFRHAIDEYSNTALFNTSAVQMWLGLMFIRIGRYLLAQNSKEFVQLSSRQERTGAVFLDACMYISQHCTEKLTLEGLAEYCGYSKYHFARAFKSYTGISFYDFLLRQRMMHCEKMLGDVSLPITEVAFRCGFGSIASFNRVFKQYKQITPSEYRRLCQQYPEHCAGIKKRNI